MQTARSAAAPLYIALLPGPDRHRGRRTARLLLPDTAAQLKPLGDGFIKLIKMMIAPIIFCTVVTGIAGMENMKAVGKTGVLALLYFEVVSTLALIVGLVIVNVVQPGVGMNVDVSHARRQVGRAVRERGRAAERHRLPAERHPDDDRRRLRQGRHPAGAAVLGAVRLRAARGRRAGASGLRLRRSASQVLFRIVGIIMRLAPIGAFGAMAFTIGKYGLGTLASLGKLMACFYATCLFFIFFVLGPIAACTASASAGSCATFATSCSSCSARPRRSRCCRA